MVEGFGRWWNDPKKHYKRKNFWLPAAKSLKSRIGDSRPFRYFTLCAREMIDVFMLAKEGVLHYDSSTELVEHVRFCESNLEQYTEIMELIGEEGSGFFGRLEELILFKDDSYTAQFPDTGSLSMELEDQGLTKEAKTILQKKTIHFHVKASFPFDFINLDFCGYYYPHPPQVLEINDAVARVLEWQKRESREDFGKLKVKEFIMSITCRHDQNIASEAEVRLTNVIKGNNRDYSRYRSFLQSKRGITDIDQWVRNEKLDFFLSAWPKEITRLAEDRNWKMEILAYLYYDRVDDEGLPYNIVCLVARFKPSRSSGHLANALFVLDKRNHQFLEDIPRNSSQWKALIADLRQIRDLRNSQARQKKRPELPPP